MITRLLGLAACAVLVLFTGCRAVEAVTESLGDKAIEGLICWNEVAVTSSDATANGAPTGKVRSIVGDVTGIPLRAGKNEVLKDYCKIIVTETPGFFDFTSKKKEVKIWITMGTSTELQRNLFTVVAASMGLFSGQSESAVAEQIAALLTTAVQAATKEKQEAKAK